jgi:hypothetical protein
MKRLLFVLLICTAALGLMAVDVSGNQSGTWTAANNPYQVVGAITVPAGSNLTIEPGVWCSNGKIPDHGLPAHDRCRYSRR